MNLLQASFLAQLCPTTFNKNSPNTIFPAQKAHPCQLGHRTLRALIQAKHWISAFEYLITCLQLFLSLNFVGGFLSLILGYHVTGYRVVMWWAAPGYWVKANNCQNLSYLTELWLLHCALIANHWMKFCQEQCHSVGGDLMKWMGGHKDFRYQFGLTRLLKGIHLKTVHIQQELAPVKLTCKAPCLFWR